MEVVDDWAGRENQEEEGGAGKTRGSGRGWINQFMHIYDIY